MKTKRDLKMVSHPPGFLYYCYGLFDPRNNECRYVGASWNVNARLSLHYGDKSNAEKRAWFRELDALGLVAEVRILEPIRQWQTTPIERKWVEHYHNLGHRLLNRQLVPGYNNPVKRARKLAKAVA